MKRPFALCGLTYLAVQTAVFYTCVTAGFILCGFAVIAGVLCLIFIKPPSAAKTLSLVCAVCAAACLVSCFFTISYARPIASAYDGQEVRVYGCLREYPEKSYGSYRYEINAVEINGKKENVKIMLRTAEYIEIEPFDNIECILTLNNEDAGYYLSKGIFYTANAEYNCEYTVTPCKSRPLGYYAAALRKKLCHALDALIPDRLAGLAKAVTLGDKASLDSELKADFRKTGSSHIIVISGMHLVIVVTLLSALLRKIWKNRFFVCGFSMAFVLGFMSLTGFTPSVVRSGVMMLILLLGKMLFLNADSLNSMGIAALILCLPNPYAPGDVGLLLSFAATAGIILLRPFISMHVFAFTDRFTVGRLKITRYIAETLSVTASAFVAITPITLLAFGSFSPVTFIASVIVTPFISVMIITSLFAAALFFAGALGVLAYPFALISCVCGSIAVFTIESLAKIPFATFYVDKVSGAVFTAAVCIMAAAAIMLKNRFKSVRYFAFMIAMVILAGVGASVCCRDDSLIVMNTGGGSTVAVSSPEGLAVLACGGSPSKEDEIIRILSLKSNTVSFLSAANTDKSLSRYAPGIMEEFDCCSVLLYDTDKTSEAIARCCENASDLTILGENRHIATRLWDKITVDAVNTDGKTWEYVNTESKTLMIAPENGDCADLPEEYRTADIIIATDNPKQHRLLKCGTLIYTGDEESFGDYSRSFSDIADEIVLPSGEYTEINLKE